MATHRVGLLAATALILVVAAVAFGVAYGHARTPDDLAGARTATTFPVVMERFDDARQVAAQPLATPLRPLAANASGILTSTSCRPGQVVRSGDPTPWTIDGAPSLALHVARPPYRTVRLGDSGPDVRALTAAVSSASDEPPPLDGSSFNLAALDAYNVLRDQIGLPAVSVFDPSQIVWLARPRVVVATCPALLGDPVGPGVELATLTPVTRALTIVRWPTDLVGGQRVLRIGDASATVDAATASVTAPRALSRLLAAVHVARPARKAVSQPIDATLALARPIRIASIPASAVADGFRQCVVDASGTPHPVIVVASSLGRAEVEFIGSTEVPTRVMMSVGARRC